jgi:hypothetical protein
MPFSVSLSPLWSATLCAPTLMSIVKVFIMQLRLNFLCKSQFIRNFKLNWTSVRQMLRRGKNSKFILEWNLRVMLFTFTRSINTTELIPHLLKIIKLISRHRPHAYLQHVCVCVCVCTCVRVWVFPQLGIFTVDTYTHTHTHTHTQRHNSLHSFPSSRHQGYEYDYFLILSTYFETRFPFLLRILHLTNSTLTVIGEDGLTSHNLWADDGVV